MKAGNTPHREDWNGWISHIDKRLLKLSKVKISDKGEISIPDGLKATRLNFFAELRYWADREQHPPKNASLDRETDTIKEARDQLMQEIKEHFALTFEIASKWEDKQEAAEILNELASFGKLVVKKTYPKNYNSIIPFANTLKAFLAEKRWPTADELRTRLTDLKQNISPTRFSENMAFFDLKPNGVHLIESSKTGRK